MRKTSLCTVNSSVMYLRIRKAQLLLIERWVEKGQNFHHTVVKVVQRCNRKRVDGLGFSHSLLLKEVFQPWHVNCIHINKPVPTTGLLSIAFLHQMMYNGGRLTTFLEHLASFNKSWELRKALWGQNDFEIVRYYVSQNLNFWYQIV